MKRRNFMTDLSSGVLGLGLAKKFTAAENHPLSAQTGTSPKIKKYNPFGKTGLKVSDVSCGAISLFEPNVLRYAYECGVTYFDTAEGYLRTKSETFIGQALKDVRDKVMITTKHWHDFSSKITKSSIIGRMEASLKRLQTDHVDVAMVHNIDELTPLRRNEEVLGAYEQLKKEGKVRFSGFSTHNPKVTLGQALDFDFAQVILLIYNHMESKEVEPMIKQVREKGIATVAMKVMAGGMQGNLKSLINQETSYPQAAIRWVLSNPDVDCCIPTMSSYSHVEEYVAASGRPLDRKALKLIADYKRQADRHYCRVSCKACLSACPDQVAVNDVLRYAMYFENYKIEKEAVRFYAEMDGGKKPLPCSGCPGPCESACPYGLKVREKLIHAHEILTV
jgi:aryl-alcohol dehydrogenase-like predicted oxidoreductase